MRLADRFGGFRFDAAAQSADSNTPSLLHVDPDFLTSLDGTDLIDQVLGHMDLPPGRLSFARGGDSRHLPAPDGVLTGTTRPEQIQRVRLGGLGGCLLEGYTAILNAIDLYGDPQLDNLCTDLERVWGTQVQVNCYISDRGAEGFGAHWDDHDVIVLQIAGRKYWELHQPSALSPVRNFCPEQTSGAVVWSGVLQPGQALYVPRGWGHRVEDFNELSVHYTFSIRRQSFADVLQALGSRPDSSGYIREGVPATIASGSHPPGSTIEVDGQARFSQTVRDLLADDALEHHIALWRARIPPRVGGTMAHTFDAMSTSNLAIGDFLVAGPFPGGVAFVDDDSGGNAVHLAAGRVQLSIERRALGALAPLVRGEKLHVKDIHIPCGAPHCTCTDSLVRVLLNAGWISMCPS